MSRLLIIIGLLLIAFGVVWPRLQKLGFGRLPGDIVIDRGNTRFYFPLTSSILISLLLSLLLWLFRR